MSVADPNRTILTGREPVHPPERARTAIPIRPTPATGGSSIARPGPGHVLYLKSELTEGRWRIYSDNIAMARWLQKTVQGMLNAELKDLTIPVTDAAFSKSGDPRYFWTEHVSAHGRRDRAHLVRHRRAAADPHPAQPGAQPPALRRLHRADPRARRRLTVNGQQARGKPWKREREGRPFSTCALAFSESWTGPGTQTRLIGPRRQ